jgi:hypothetical protein
VREPVPRTEPAVQLCAAIFDRFADMELMFDTIPPWFSRKTLRGLRRTPHYTAPPMPWGAKRSQLEPLPREWSSQSPRCRSARTAPPAARLLRVCRSSKPSHSRDIPPSIVRARSARLDRLGTLRLEAATFQRSQIDAEMLMSRRVPSAR